MMSLRALGNLSASGTSAKAAAHYYQEVSSDYYAKDDIEKQGGKWIGHGAKLQGLEGAVNQLELQLVLAGRCNGQSVQNAGEPNRQMGWDLTFSAPKSVSIVWAFGDKELRGQIEVAHQKATEAAYRYIELKITTRRGTMGKIKEPAHTFAVSYLHHTSRANDPQLHSHIVVSNFCQRADCTVGTIESRVIYENKMSAGGLYQAELAYQMRQLGFEVENDKKGTFRLKAVDKHLEKLFSKREQEISQVAQKRGLKNYAETRQVVLDTRPNKIPTTLLERQQYWHNEAKAAGLSTQISCSPQALTPAIVDNKILTDTISAKIVKDNSVFKEKDAIRNFAIADLGSTNASGVKKRFEEALQQGQIIAIGQDKAGNIVYSTAAMIGIEKQMLTHVENLSIRNNYAVDINQTLVKYKYLTLEQCAAIEAACSKTGIAVIQGRAGTGKTTMLEAVKEAYEQQGFKVQGICYTGQAAQNLENETGIKSQTIASWQNQQQDNEFNQGKKIDNKTVLILDEAGMIGSKPMSDILSKADKAHAKIILVGDERQLQPIEAGGALKAVDNHLIQTHPEASSRMEDIKRQHDEWMRSAVKEAAQGNTKEALKELDKHHKIEIYHSPQDARNKLVDDYIKENHNQQEGIILTNHKADAIKINQEVREKLQAQGKINEDKLKVDNGQRNIALAQGDRIMLIRNDYNLDVRNGQRATVNEVNEKNKTIKVEMDNGQNKIIDTQNYNHIEYGWASTTHKAQGATCKHAYVYAHTQEPMSSQQSTYVQISRSREETKIYAVSGERSIERPWQDEREIGASIIEDNYERREAFNEMAKSWGKDAAKETTLNYAAQNNLSQEITQPNITAKTQEKGYEMEMEIYCSPLTHPLF